MRYEITRSIICVGILSIHQFEMKLESVVSAWFIKPETRIFRIFFLTNCLTIHVQVSWWAVSCIFQILDSWKVHHISFCNVVAASTPKMLCLRISRHVFVQANHFTVSLKIFHSEYLHFEVNINSSFNPACTFIK